MIHLKRKNLLIIICAIIIIIVISGLNGLYRQQVGVVASQKEEKYDDLFFSYEVIRYPASAEIANNTPNITLGFNVDTDELGFGLIPTGGNFGTKHINLENRMESTAKIKAYARGDISPLIEFPQNNIMLGGKETLRMDVRLSTAADTEPGNYAGEVGIKIIRARHAIGSLLLPWV